MIEMMEHDKPQGANLSSASQKVSKKLFTEMFCLDTHLETGDTNLNLLTLSTLFCHSVSLIQLTTSQH